MLAGLKMRTSVGPSDDQSWGLTCRFKVSVGNNDLGGWDSCKGLQIDFNLKEVREGGTNDHSYWLPDQIKYDKITLTRAMTKASSKVIQNWLKSYIDQGQKSKEATAKITLLDARNEEVQSWTLLGVFPLQWQGPSLTAQDSKVAVETLVLVHEGFAAFDIYKDSTGDGQRVKARLTTKDEPKEWVEFTYSPQKITLSRSTNTRNNPNTRKDGFTGSSWGGVTPRMLKGTAILAGTGEYVRDKAELLLLRWLDPGTSGGAGSTSGPGGGKSGKQNKSATPKKLTFTWGQWKPIDCTLSQVSVDYQRFDALGNPTRAEVQFTVKEEPSQVADKSTNPTSGGLPGRQAHVVTDGENLQLIAVRNYGQPGAWRAIADVNGIDDPFRLRPGQTVYLPNGNELIRA
jgi:phage tail-like protein